MYEETIPAVYTYRILVFGYVSIKFHPQLIKLCLPTIFYCNQQSIASIFSNFRACYTFVEVFKSGNKESFLFVFIVAH